MELGGKRVVFTGDLGFDELRTELEEARLGTALATVKRLF